jgi:hypothetical protein
MDQKLYNDTLYQVESKLQDGYSAREHQLSLDPINIQTLEWIDGRIGAFEEASYLLRREML